MHLEIVVFITKRCTKVNVQKSSIGAFHQNLFLGPVDSFVHVVHTVSHHWSQSLCILLHKHKTNVETFTLVWMDSIHPCGSNNCLQSLYYDTNVQCTTVKNTFLVPITCVTV